MNEKEAEEIFRTKNKKYVVKERWLITMLLNKDIFPIVTEDTQLRLIKDARDKICKLVKDKTIQELK